MSGKFKPGDLVWIVTHDTHEYFPGVVLSQLMTARYEIIKGGKLESGLGRVYEVDAPAHREHGRAAFEWMLRPRGASELAPFEVQTDAVAS